MPWNNRYKRIVLTGPEATGKTTLANALAERCEGRHVPEYARTYVEGLGRRYTRDDVEHIARVQVRQYEEAEAAGIYPVFFDTFLVITKVWLSVVYGSAPAWLDAEIRRCAADLYLLCYPDLPWEPDPVRENPGIRRIELFTAYQTELERNGLPLQVITGSNEIRVQNCLAVLE